MLAASGQVSAVSYVLRTAVCLSARALLEYREKMNDPHEPATVLTVAATSRASEAASGPGAAPLAPAPARSARRRDAAVAGLLALAGALLYIPTAPFYFRPDDDGHAIFDALLVRQGLRPYLDFFVHDSPFIHYWNALLLQIGGVDMLTLRYGLVPFKILLLPAIYLLARPVAGRPVAALAAVMVLMSDSAVNFGMPHPGWYAMALALLGLLGMRAWLGSGRGAWLVGAGIAFGVAVDVKQNLGLFLLGAGGLFLLEPLARAAPDHGLIFARVAGDRRLWALRALAWLVVLGGLLVMLRDHLGADLLALLWVPLLALAGLSLWPGPPGAASTALLGPAVRRVGLLAAGAALAVGPWLLALGLISGFDQLIPGLLLVPSELPRALYFPYKAPPTEFWQVGALVVGAPLVGWLSLRLWPEVPRRALLLVGLFGAGWLLLPGRPDVLWQGGIFSWYYVPPALIWLGLLLQGRGWDGAAPPTRLGTAALYDRFLLAAGAFGLLQLYPLMDRVHGAWSYPFTLPLLALVLTRLPGWAARALPPVALPAARRVLLVALLALPLFWAWFIAGWRVNLWWDVPASLAAGRPVAAAWQPITVPHTRLIAHTPDPAAYQAVYDLITAKTRPGEPIYAFPNEQAFYVICDRPRGSTHSYLLPGITSAAEQQAAIDDLTRNGVRYVVMFVPSPGMEQGLGGYGPLDPLANYLRTQYHAVGVFGNYAVLERN
jgi:hypothetical protein